MGRNLKIYDTLKNPTEVATDHYNASRAFYSAIVAMRQTQQPKAKIQAFKNMLAKKTVLSIEEEKMIRSLMNELHGILKGAVMLAQKNQNRIEEGIAVAEDGITIANQMSKDFDTEVGLRFHDRNRFRHVMREAKRMRRHLNKMKKSKGKEIAGQAKKAVQKEQLRKRKQQSKGKVVQIADLKKMKKQPGDKLLRKRGTG